MYSNLDYAYRHQKCLLKEREATVRSLKASLLACKVEAKSSAWALRKGGGDTDSTGNPCWRDGLSTRIRQLEASKAQLEKELAEQTDRKQEALKIAQTAQGLVGQHLANSNKHRQDVDQLHAQCQTLREKCRLLEEELRDAGRKADEQEAAFQGGKDQWKKDSDILNKIVQELKSRLETEAECKTETEENNRQLMTKNESLNQSLEEAMAKLDKDKTETSTQTTTSMVSMSDANSQTVYQLTSSTCQTVIVAMETDSTQTPFAHTTSFPTQTDSPSSAFCLPESAIKYHALSKYEESTVTPQIDFSTHDGKMEVISDKSLTVPSSEAQISTINSKKRSLGLNRFDYQQTNNSLTDISALPGQLGNQTCMVSLSSHGYNQAGVGAKSPNDRTLDRNKYTDTIPSIDPWNVNGSFWKRQLRQEKDKELNSIWDNVIISQKAATTSTEHSIGATRSLSTIAIPSSVPMAYAMPYQSRHDVNGCINEPLPLVNNRGCKLHLERKNDSQTPKSNTPYDSLKRNNEGLDRKAITTNSYSQEHLDGLDTKIDNFSSCISSHSDFIVPPKPVSESGAIPTAFIKQSGARLQLKQDGKDKGSNLKPWDTSENIETLSVDGVAKNIENNSPLTFLNTPTNTTSTTSNASCLKAHDSDNTITIPHLSFSPKKESVTGLTNPDANFLNNANSIEDNTYTTLSIEDNLVDTNMTSLSKTQTNVFDVNGPDAAFDGAGDSVLDDGVTSTGNMSAYQLSFNENATSRSGRSPTRKFSLHLKSRTNTPTSSVSHGELIDRMCTAAHSSSATMSSSLQTTSSSSSSSSPSLLSKSTDAIPASTRHHPTSAPLVPVPSVTNVLRQLRHPSGTDKRKKRYQKRVLFTPRLDPVRGYDPSPITCHDSPPKTLSSNQTKCDEVSRTETTIPKEVKGILKAPSKRKSNTDVGAKYVSFSSQIDFAHEEVKSKKCNMSTLWSCVGSGDGGGDDGGDGDGGGDGSGDGDGGGDGSGDGSGDDGGDGSGGGVSDGDDARGSSVTVTTMDGIAASTPGFLLAEPNNGEDSQDINPPDGDAVMATKLVSSNSSSRTVHGPLQNTQ